MVVVIETHTEPVNPPSASPIITHTQLWDGIIHGLCNNHLLVPTITSVKVLSHTDEEIVLSQTLDDHTTIGHEPGEHKNTFTLSPPSKVRYTYMNTYIRTSPSNQPTNLRLTHPPPFSLSLITSATKNQNHHAKSIN